MADTTDIGNLANNALIFLDQVTILYRTATVCIETVKKANWENSNDVKATYKNTSVLKNNRTVFNIKGNDYRLIVKLNFERDWAFIRFIGTHGEYDKVDATEI